MGELNAQDKEFLFQTVLQVGLAVMTASPSGVEGTFLETETMVEAPAQLAKNFPNSTLIQSILEQNQGGEEEPEDGEEAADEQGEADEDVVADESDEEEEEPERPERPDQILAEAVTMCRQAAEILQAVDADEALQYKNWVMACGAAVAEVSKEGGFLGFRKKLVTDDERDALKQVAEALGVPMPQLP